MRPHSSDPSRRTATWPGIRWASFPLVALLAAAALSAVAGPALAATGSVKVRKTGSDTTDVREISIDDEGIRIVGSNKRVVVPSAPGRHDVRVDVDLDPNLRILGVDGDSLDHIVIRSHRDNEVVQFFRDVHVRRGDNVGTVVALFGNVRNEGVISGDCVSILGSITQGDSAVILGEAVSIGGSVLDEGVGSRIEGQTVSIGFLPSFGFGAPSVLLLLLLGLVEFLLLVGVSALIARLFPERLVRMADTISRRTFLSLLLGLLSVPLALMLGFLLLVTVIGIPLAILLPLLFMLAALIGFAAAALLLGSKLLGRRVEVGAGVLAPVAAGTAFITVFYLLGVPLTAADGFLRVIGFGLIMLWFMIGTICWMFGLGALLLSRLGQEPRDANGTAQWATGAPYPASPGTPPAPSSTAGA